MKLVSVPGPTAQERFSIIIMPKGTIAIPHRRTCEVWGLSHHKHLEQEASLCNDHMTAFLKAQGFLKPHVRMQCRVYTLRDFCSIFESDAKDKRIVDHIRANIDAVLGAGGDAAIPAKKRGRSPPIVVSEEEEEEEEESPSAIAAAIDMEQDVDALTTLLAADLKTKLRAKQPAWKKAHVDKHEEGWRQHFCATNRAAWEAAWCVQNEARLEVACIATNKDKWMRIYIDMHAAEWKAKCEAAMMEFVQGRMGSKSFDLLYFAAAKCDLSL